MYEQCVNVQTQALDPSAPVSRRWFECRRVVHGEAGRAGAPLRPERAPGRAGGRPVRPRGRA
eukprot:1102071-Prymnesium_polylepis.1